MSDDAADRARTMVDAVYRAESRRVLSTLIRLLGDFDSPPRTHCHPVYPDSRNTLQA